MQESRNSDIFELISDFNSLSDHISDLIGNDVKLNAQQMEALAGFYDKRQLILDKINSFFDSKEFENLSDNNKQKINRKLRNAIDGDKTRLSKLKGRVDELKGKLKDLQNNRAVLKYNK